MGVRAFTSPELTLLRTKGPFTKLYLTVFKPATIYTARVNGAPASHDKLASIEYDGGSGTLANVKNGMTIRFGSAASLRDRGEERIRKTPDSNTFFFGETSLIDISDNDFIAVVDDFQLWAKHLRIDGSNFYIDYDVAYSDQHTNFDPVPMMGGHRILWLEGASVAMTIPQIADSWVIGSTISSRSTTCAGATVTNGTSTNPTITFTSPGRYVIYTTVTAANGKSFTGVRYVYVHSAADMPYTDFEILDDVSGSWEDGGFSCRIGLFTDAADASTFEEGALCVIHRVDYYDGVKQNIEFDKGTGNILFIGRIAEENISVNKEVATVEFTLEGFQERGKKTDEVVNLSGVVVDESGRGNSLFSLSQGHVSQNFFPYGVELAKNTPTLWTQMPALTVKRALFDLLHWYSTATQIMDVYIEDDSRFAAELSASSETLWEKINEIAYLTIFMVPFVDQWGKLFIEIEPQLIPEASRNPVQVMEITEQDWAGQIEIARTPTLRGSSEIIDRLLLETQAKSNQLAGLYYGWHHNEFGPIQINLAEMNFGFTIAPRQKAYIEIAAADNNRGITANIDIIPREVVYEYNKQGGILIPRITFEAETFEAQSMKGEVPGSEGTEISVILPPPPPFPPPYPPIEPIDPTTEEGGPATILLVDDTKGILLTENFNEDNADIVYQFWNYGIASADIPMIGVDSRPAVLFVCPNGACYTAIRHTLSFNRYFVAIYRAEAIGGTWVKVIDQAWHDANSGLGGSIWILGVGYNPNKPEEVAFILGSTATTTKKFFIGANNSWVQGVNFTFSTDHAGNLTFGGGAWVWDALSTTQEAWRRFSADGTVQELISANYGQGNSYGHARAGTSATIVKSKTKVTGSGKIMRSVDNATTITFPVDATETFGPNIAVAPDGLYMLANWDTGGGGNRGKSPDGGTSWSGLPNLPFGGNYYFAYAGGEGVESRWIAARGVVRYSDNAFGAENWVNKEGNINFLIPVGMSIQKIVVPGLANGNS